MTKTTTGDPPTKDTPQFVTMDQHNGTWRMFIQKRQSDLNRLAELERRVDILWRAYISGTPPGETPLQVFFDDPAGEIPAGPPGPPWVVAEMPE